MLGVIIIAGILFYASPSPELVTDLRHFHHTPVHKPPVQSNSTSGDVHWFSDLKWLNPFSASVTFDDDRSVLPPLPLRPPIYTFYDREAEKDAKIKAAESKLLLLWRRAWWAQGFRPVVLARSEAMNNPLYQLFQSKKLPTNLEADFIRWLAWGTMGNGILANWLCLPMGPHDDALLSFLRRGEYPILTGYDGLGSGLFTGEKAAVNAAIQEALDSPKIKEAGNIFALLKSETLEVDTKPTALALYDAPALAEHYKSITEAYTTDRAQGLTTLAKLINSHLHLTFLNSFPEGFAVLTPFTTKTRSLSSTAHALASSLRSCSDSPLPDSCPPNNPSCKSCSSLSPRPLSVTEYYTNSSRLYTIGTVPHPYLLASLLAKTKDITTRRIRRDTARDRWLGEVTQKTLGKEVGGPSRLVPFKESVASEQGIARSLWMVDEPPPSHRDIEYHFGFAIAPFNVTEEDGGKESGEIANDQEASKKERKVKEKERQHQVALIDASKEIVRHRRKKKERTGVKEMVEAWNLADTEAWHFVRAFRARERVEREKWEIQERRFAGGDEGEGGWKLFDRQKREKPVGAG